MKKYVPDYRIYGGEINNRDFNTYYPTGNNVDKYVDSINQYKKIQEKGKNGVIFTIDELKRLKMISENEGDPSNELTDKRWQRELKIRKKFITPVYDKDYKNPNNPSYEININSILENIRNGKVDYCYHMYQILDLLPFHFDELKTKLCDGYWEVWLD